MLGRKSKIVGIVEHGADDFSSLKNGYNIAFFANVSCKNMLDGQNVEGFSSRWR